jgi:hypothetical protein
MLFNKSRITSITNDLTVFVTRIGMIVLAVSIAASTYGALVNAVGFYILQQFFDWGLANEAGFKGFKDAYVHHIGYDLAQMELINGLTTFAVGVFLVVGITYHLVRISVAQDTAMEQRGKCVQDLVNVFLWMTFAGFLFVFVSYIADKLGFFTSSDPSCTPHLNTVCSIYGVQWLLASKHDTRELDPLQIYATSAARIVPFLIPALVPPLRAGLNVAADVLLYILPPEFPFSLQKKSRERFRALLTHMQAQHGNTDIAVLAHSQGTVIAYDVLCRESLHIKRLITVGSPLGSLYRRFLGRSIGALVSIEWINIYRFSDYIAGPISNGTSRDHILTTNYRFAHFKYFEDGAVIKYVQGV